MAEFPPYSDEWKKEASKLSKSELLNIFQSVGKEKENIKDINLKMLEILEEFTTHHFDFMGCIEIKDLQEDAKKLIKLINDLQC